MRVRTTALRAFVAALTIGALAACGDDDNDAASDTTEAEESDTTEADDTDTTEAEETDTTEAEDSDTTEAEDTDTTEAEETDTTDAETDSTEAETATTTAGSTGDEEFCSLVTPEQLSELTGTEWGEGEPEADGCTWSSADSLSAFSITGSELPDVATAQTVADSICDAGTVSDPGFVDAGLAEFATSCQVAGTPTVQVYGDGVMLTFVAFTVSPGVEVDQVQSDLNTIAETVLSS